MGYWNYWGKVRKEDDAGEPYHLLVYHSLDVAAVGSVMLVHNPKLRKKLALLTGLNEPSISRWLVFFLALHDIGKFSDSFQNLVPDVLNILQGRSSTLNYTERHDTLGFHIWKQILRDIFIETGIITAKTGSKRRKAPLHPIDIWMGAVTGHHGQPPKASLSGFNRYFEGSQDFFAVTEYLHALTDLLLTDVTQ